MGGGVCSPREPVPPLGCDKQARPYVSVIEPTGLQIPKAYHRHDAARPHHQVATSPSQEEEATQHQCAVPGGNGLYLTPRNMLIGVWCYSRALGTKSPLFESH